MARILLFLEPGYYANEESLFYIVILGIALIKEDFWQI